MYYMYVFSLYIYRTTKLSDSYYGNVIITANSVMYEGFCFCDALWLCTRTSSCISCCLTCVHLYFIFPTEA